MFHNATMDIEAWVKSLPGNPSITAAANEAKIQKTTLFRQIERGQLSAETVISLCRAYRVDVAKGLISHGYCTTDDFELNDLSVEQALPSASWNQLFAEITRRVNASPMFEGEFELSLDTPVEITVPADFEERKARALRAANEGKAAAQKRTPRLEEPESP